MEKKHILSPYEKQIRQRIIEIINNFCEGSQRKFVDRTGINKGSVSQYVNGKNTPSWSNAEKIAAAFGIDVAWVMAVDIIPDGVPEEDIILSPKEKKLIVGYRDADITTKSIVDKILLNDAAEK